jgi:hypothetical protein
MEGKRILARLLGDQPAGHKVGRYFVKLWMSR